MKNVRIFKTKSNIEAMGIENMLRENSIPCKIINKMDSSYANTFGTIDIYVEKTNIMMAKHLLEHYFNKTLDD